MSEIFSSEKIERALQALNKLISEGELINRIENIEKKLKNIEETIEKHTFYITEQLDVIENIVKTIRNSIMAQALTVKKFDINDIGLSKEIIAKLQVEEETTNIVIIQDSKNYIEKEAWFALCDKLKKEGFNMRKIEGNYIWTKMK